MIDKFMEVFIRPTKKIKLKFVASDVGRDSEGNLWRLNKYSGYWEVKK